MSDYLAAIADDLDRFWVKVDRNGPIPEYRPNLGPCWLWLAYTNSDGYGLFAIWEDGHTHTERAHVVAWGVTRGAVPDGLVLDHLCRIRSCVNPDHLEPVTNAENIRRGMAPTIVAYREGTCLRGFHEMTGANAMSVGQGRTCRECHRARRRERRAAVDIMSLPPKICEWCQEEYRNPDYRRRFCSLSCSVKRQHAEARAV
jgi:hypothetical protein